MAAKKKEEITIKLPEGSTNVWRLEKSDYILDSDNPEVVISKKILTQAMLTSICLDAIIGLIEIDGINPKEYLTETRTGKSDKEAPDVIYATLSGRRGIWQSQYDPNVRITMFDENPIIKAKKGTRLYAEIDHAVNMGQLVLTTEDTVPGSFERKLLSIEIPIAILDIARQVLRRPEDEIIKRVKEEKVKDLGMIVGLFKMIYSEKGMDASSKDRIIKAIVGRLKNESGDIFHIIEQQNEKHYKRIYEYV